MITYIGQLSIAQSIPLFANSLSTVKASLLQELADLASDAKALEGDIVALQADAAALASELANVKGLADGILAQLTAGPSAVVRGIQAAVASILDGSSLVALQQALLGGPAVVLASLQSALAEVQSRIASYQARIAGLAGRVLAIADRIKALAARVAALKDLLARLLQMQSLLATAGIHVFRYTGRAGSFGSDFDGEYPNGLPGGDADDLTNGIVLLTSATDPWAAMQKVFKVAL